MKSLISVNDFNELYQFPAEYLQDLAFAEDSGWVNIAQTDCLKKMLGYSAFKELAAAYALDSTLTAYPKLKALVYGEEYTYNDVLYNWQGLKEVVLGYCFCEGLKKKTRPVITTTGANVSTNENEEIASLNSRYISVWNRLIDNWAEAYKYLYESAYDYSNVRMNSLGYYINSFGI